MYTKENLLQDVKIEADKIKLNATKKEIARLDFNTFRATSRESCIYGQMTGNCFSARAADLIEVCCPRYFTPDVMKGGCRYGGYAPVEEVLQCVNGTEVAGFYEERVSSYCSKHFSSIEAYIVMQGANNENLIAYLKGETDQLTL